MSAVARRPRLLPATLVGLAIAACGSQGGEVSPSAKPSATATPTASPSPARHRPCRHHAHRPRPLGLKVRDSGSPDGTTLGSLGQGTVVTVVAYSGQNSGWYQVKGETQTGWITANPVYTSARHFELYSSDAHGFTALYLNTWSFTEAGRRW